MVGTMMVAVTPSLITSTARSASHRPMIRMGAPLASAPRAKARGAPWKSWATMRCLPSRGSPSPWAPNEENSHHCSKVDSESRVRSTPLGRPVVPDV